MSEAVKIITSGKTKEVFQDPENEQLVIVRSKDDITAGDGARHEIMPGKGELSTATTSNIFRLLGREGIKNHFLEQLSPTEFLAQKMKMIPLEIVVRRYAYGSYLQRDTEAKKAAKYPFLITEIFAKDDSNHDPLVRYNFKEGVLSLYDAHKPQNSGSLLGVQNITDSRFGLSQKDRKTAITLARGAFELLEMFFGEHGVALADMKVEAGYNPSGAIILGDVIDADSCRLWVDGDPERNIDKDLFRTGRSIDEVAAAYLQVQDITAKL